MKKVFRAIIIFLFIFNFALFAKDTTSVEAKNSEISDNLDLEAVASLFGESKDLEDFEKKLNDPKIQISNLDLNKDGEVDYLRVVESSESNTHVVAIQAVIGKDQFQDVATIDVEKDNKGETKVQVVGDVYMYGTNYIVEPVYVRPPVIFAFFWGAFYRPWHSPYYWHYYPHYYRPWHPYPIHIYRNNVHIHVHHTYRYVSVRHSRTAVIVHKNVRRNDYGIRYPNKSFVKRNNGITNRQQLTIKRNTVNIKTTKTIKSTGRPVNKNWKKPKTNNNRSLKSNKVTKTSSKNKTQLKKSKTKVKSTKKIRKSTSKVTIKGKKSLKKK